MMALLSILENIRTNRTRASYSVSPLEGMEGIFFGLNNDGQPCLFITADQVQSIPSIRTSQIRVEFFKKYKLIVGENEEREGIYHSILCLSKDPLDIQTFIAVLESMLKELNGNISVGALNSMFHSLVNLFSINPEADATLMQRGLWAELFFMQQNEGFTFWASSWHSEPHRLFDFSTNNMRTEIKCTVKQERIHEFSHNQLVTISNDRIVVVSFLLQEDDSGTSLRELIESAKAELRGSPDYIKLERAIRSVRMNEPDTDGPKFNSAHAIQNTAWFRSTEVPRFPIQEPTGVTGTHYRSDLTQANRLSQQETSEWIENWGAQNPE